MNTENLSKKELDYYSSLWTSRGQRKYHHFAIEGYKIIEDAIQSAENSPFVIKEIIADSLFLSKKYSRTLLELCAQKSVSVRIVKRHLLERILPSRTPQGIMAVLRMPKRTDDQRLGDILNMKGRILFLDGVQDPGNVGTLIRSSAAFGADSIIIGQDSARLYNSKTIRATAGAFLKIPVLDLVQRDAAEIVEKFKKLDFSIIALSKSDDAIPLRQFESPQKALFIIGNEGAGIRKDVAKIATHTVSIKISRSIESLNAAVSGSILLYHICDKQI